MSFIMAIPKTIHYIWVGDKKMPDMVLRCIASWRRELSEYELKFWNESNFPDMNHSYLQAMYKQKKWAFVSDYMRFWILYKYGGIYLDTDMEVLKPLDKFLVNEAFIGRVSSGHIACGIVGAVKGNDYISRILDFYNSDTSHSIRNTSPRVAQQALGCDSGAKVYDSNIFYPCDVDSKCTKRELASAYTNHHWAESGVRFVLLRKVLRRLGVMPVIKKMLNKHD